MHNEHRIGLGILVAIGAFAFWSIFRPKSGAPDERPALDQSHVQPGKVLGFLRRDTTRSALLAPVFPSLTKTDDGIPTDAYLVMTRVGSLTNPELLLDPTPEAMFAQSLPIPQIVELLPNEERVPWAPIAGFNA